MCRSGVSPGGSRGFCLIFPPPTFSSNHIRISPLFENSPSSRDHIDEVKVHHALLTVRCWCGASALKKRASTTTLWAKSWSKLLQQRSGTYYEPQVTKFGNFVQIRYVL
ncbi:unnamed protein product [Lactuca virosa]|uniref:Uncharacterized protein n=1 Tax=Lactuca virosa TaxID=75947 RepID=A0AAU9N448_9ASTR|nr:unnamed protein product [Lactuca virosa]